MTLYPAYPIVSSDSEESHLAQTNRFSQSLEYFAGRMETVMVKETGEEFGDSKY